MSALRHEYSIILVILFAGILISSIDFTSARILSFTKQPQCTTQNCSIFSNKTLAMVGTQDGFVFGKTQSFLFITVLSEYNIEELHVYYDTVPITSLRGNLRIVNVHNIPISNIARVNFLIPQQISPIYLIIIVRFDFSPQYFSSEPLPDQLSFPYSLSTFN